MSSDEAFDPSWVATREEEQVDIEDEKDDMEYESGASDDEPIEDPDGFIFTLPFTDKMATDPPVFTGNRVGAVPGTEVYPNPAQCFKAFVDEEVMRWIGDCTNDRGASWCQEKGRDVINGVKWRPVDVEELYIYFALTLVMGIHVLPKLHMYWGTHPIWGGPEIFHHCVMSRGRFLNITKFLRFGKISEASKSNPRGRLEDYLDILRRKCQAKIEPGEHIAIDEALILYKGRLYFKQYIKSKRSRFGVKIFFLAPAEDKWQGLSWNWEVFYGASDSHIMDLQPEGTELSKSEWIVAYLMRRLLNEGRHCLTDNWYSSQRLADHLEENGTTLTGTIRTNRGVPEALRDGKLKRHDSAFMRKGNTLYCKYEDKKSVYMITTKYKADMLRAERITFQGEEREFQRPFVVD